MDTFHELSLSDKAKIIISTFFFAGYSPIVPGTAGTAAGVLLYLLLAQYASIWIYFAAMMIIAAVGVWASDFAEQFFGVKDPPQVVIDEVAGFMLAMLFITPTLLHVITGFVIFRILDIIKIPPARAMERFRGGAGIVADDLVAGFYSNILAQIIFLIIKII